MCVCVCVKQQCYSMTEMGSHSTAFYNVTPVAYKGAT